MGLDVALTLLVAAVVAYTLVWRAWRPWSESHVLEPNPVTIDSPGSPEWVALQDRRREIDDDPLLTDAARADLVNDWRAMAEELKPRLMGSASAPSPTRHAWGLSFWKSAQVTSVAAFALAIVLLALIGGFRQGAFDWPGRTGGTAPAATASAPGSAMSHPGDGVGLADRVAGLKLRLESNPDDLQGWVLLARSLANMNDFQGAAQALRRAQQLNPEHPTLLADLADMVAMTQDKSLLGEPEALIEKALQNDPNHEKALALAASAAEQRGDQAKAQQYWSRFSEVQQQSLRNTGTSSPAAAPVSAPVESNVGLSIKATVLLPSSFRRGLGGAEVLFVVVKAQPGPGMPLAALRIPASALGQNEIAVELNDQHVLQAAQTNAIAYPLYLQARLAKQGTAQPDPADRSSDWLQLKSPSDALNAVLELK